MPLSDRMEIFRKEFKEFEKMNDKTIAHLIHLYDNNLNLKFTYSSMPNIVLGSLILWISWFFFNGASGYTIIEITN